jgi:photosystem II stability/assembly factor-like uncharacterized protein
LLKTSDGGKNWSILFSSNESPPSESVFFTGADTGYIVSSSSVLKTTNGGIDWINQTPSLNGYYNAVFFRDRNSGYIIGGEYSDSCTSIMLKTTNGGYYREIE